MDVNVINELQNGLSAAYINGSVAANLAYKPAFVSNNPEEGKKVISSVEDELLRCDEFQISVAFITIGGVTPLLQTLKELEKKGVKGQILTTNYLNFSEPRALEKLNSLKNVTLKMYDVEAAGNGFHTKGYIFKKEEIYRIIIGSSNMTSAALTVNKEWNTKLISTENGEVAEEIVEEFQKLWNSEYALPYNDFYEVYKERYNIIKHQREIAKSEEIPSLEKYRLKPNSMQERFIANLRKILEQGEERALLISATGTGKTYASAFAMRELGFKRVLFLVHRVTLAKQAKKSFEKVFDKKVTMGLVGAGFYEYEKDYVFATVETLNRDAHLFRYQPNAFDCIILDEAHHSSNNIYTKVINYFNPKLFLGMTATPDKRDDNQEGKNIYEIFHYQIAHEIRLQQAMEKDKYKNSLNEQEKLTLEYLSKTILSGVRPDELAILSQLLYRDHIGVADFIKEYQKTYGIKISTSQVNEAIQVLQGHFVSKEAEYQKFRQIDILENDQSGMIRRLKSYTERLAHIQFYTQVEDIIKVGIARYKDKYFPGRIVDSPFVLYEKYSRRDVSLLMNCGKDLSSIMYGMKRIEDDVFIFITYHKEESQDEKNYVDGKPDYADTFEDDLIFKWDSQIGKGLDSSYMKDVLEAERKHLLVKKSDAETSFYYMGQFTVVEARNARKEDNRGRMQPITKVTMKMHHPVREDLLRYLQSNITA